VYENLEILNYSRDDSNKKQRNKGGDLYLQPYYWKFNLGVMTEVGIKCPLVWLQI